MLTKMMADTLLGGTSHEICATVLKQMQTEAVLHDVQGEVKDLAIVGCELILRQDLLHRFLAKQALLREELQKFDVDQLKIFSPSHKMHRGFFSLLDHDVARQVVYRDRPIDKDRLIEALVKPRMAFHGTLDRCVPGITQHGFLMPGDRHPESKAAHKVRCASFGGKGIYATPDFLYSLYYSLEGKRQDSFQVLVCAVTLGRAADVTLLWNPNDPEAFGRFSHPIFEDTDSHLFSFQPWEQGNPASEYCVFDKAQILPCYILHLKYTPPVNV